MEHSFIIKTVATVTYENWVEVSDEQIGEYRANNPEYAESTDEEIVQAMFYGNDVEVDDVVPVDWRNEKVISVDEYKY